MALHFDGRNLFFCPKMFFEMKKNKKSVDLYSSATHTFVGESVKFRCPTILQILKSCEEALYLQREMKKLDKNTNNT